MRGDDRTKPIAGKVHLTGQRPGIEQEKGNSRHDRRPLHSEKGDPSRRALEGMSGGLERRGYDFIAPLTPEGRIDREGWKTHRGECFAHRFWDDEPAQRGLLVHRAGGRGGSTWGFELGAGARLDEEDMGFRFGDHVFRPGEYVSVWEPEGELVTFKVVSVS